MRLFRGVLERDALDPERRKHLRWKKERTKRALSFGSNSAFGLSFRKSKVMDLVSGNGINEDINRINSLGRNDDD